MIEILLQPSHPFDVIPAPDAFEQVRPELLAFPRSERVHLNHDVPTLVTTILGTLPALRGIRQELVDELTHFDVERFDRLVLYARALYFAHLCHKAAATPKVSLTELVEEATRLRNLMLPDVLALANRGLIGASEIRQLKRAPGHRGLAQDLQLMAMALERNAARLKGKTAITEAEIQRASYLSDRLLDGVGLREHGPEMVREAAELRMNAFSLLVRLYEDIRAAVAYVRRKAGDADKIAPSLFAGRGGRRREVEEKEAEVATTGSAEPMVIAAPHATRAVPAGESIMPPATKLEPILADVPFTPVAHVREPGASEIGLPGSPPLVQGEAAGPLATGVVFGRGQPFRVGLAKAGADTAGFANTG